MVELPEGTVATVADFDLAKLCAVLDASDQGYYFYCSALEAAAKAAVAAQDFRWAKILDLLSSACSMSLVPGSAAEPFRPYFQNGNRRSFMPEDFGSADIELIAELAPLTTNRMLAARLYDIAWHCVSPRVPQYASDAIDAYRSVEITEDSWISDGRECWLRAIALTRMRRNDPRLAEIVTAIEAALFAATPDDGFLSLRLADALMEHGLSKASAPRIATQLRTIADATTAGDELWRARDFYEGAAEWYRLSQDDLNESEMNVEIAKSLHAEARTRVEGRQPSYMAAASFLEDAILVLRRVPGVHRQALGVVEWLARLQAELADAGEKSKEEMAAISSGPIDVSDLIEHAEQAVRGKSVIDALGEMSSLCVISSYEKSKEQARTALCAHPLMASLHSRVIGRNGQVVAKMPGFNVAVPDSESNAAALRAQMVQTQSRVMSLRVQAIILPALDALKAEHRISLELLYQLTRQTSFVPPGRERLIAQGLQYGFEGDWGAAVHMLVPQLENLVRYHIKQNGAVTTVMDREGVINEVGLSTLMTLPEVEEFFGPDYAFEIRALFCDHFGPNLRNELAHGLLSDGEVYSAESVYVWWFMMMLVMKGWLHELKGRIAQSKAADRMAADRKAASQNGGGGFGEATIPAVPRVASAEITKP